MKYIKLLPKKRRKQDRAMAVFGHCIQIAKLNFINVVIATKDNSSIYMDDFITNHIVFLINMNNLNPIIPRSMIAKKPSRYNYFGEFICDDCETKDPSDQIYYIPVIVEELFSEYFNLGLPGFDLKHGYYAYEHAFSFIYNYFMECVEKALIHYYKNILKSTATPQIIQNHEYKIANMSRVASMSVRNSICDWSNQIKEWTSASYEYQLPAFILEDDNDYLLNHMDIVFLHELFDDIAMCTKRFADGLFDSKCIVFPYDMIMSFDTKLQKCMFGRSSWWVARATIDNLLDHENSRYDMYTYISVIANFKEHRLISDKELDKLTDKIDLRLCIEMHFIDLLADIISSSSIYSSTKGIRIPAAEALNLNKEKFEISHLPDCEREFFTYLLNEVCDKDSDIYAWCNDTILIITGNLIDQYWNPVISELLHNLEVKWRHIRQNIDLNSDSIIDMMHNEHYKHDELMNLERKSYSMNTGEIIDDF